MMDEAIMKIGYDPALVEIAVFLAVYEERKLEKEFHEASDKLYALEPGREREDLFRSVNGVFFKRLGLDVPIDSLFNELPTISENVSRCVIREAVRGRDESAEMFVQNRKTATDQRTLVIQACPRSLVHPERFIPVMRRELWHVADMLDENFQYRREEIDGMLARQNLIRDRFSVLWDLYIEGRLERMGLSSPQFDQALRAKLAHVFGIDDPAALDTGVNQVFQVGSLTYGDLMQWAKSPEALVGAEFVPSSRKAGDAGAPCPLCGFPTHDWFEFGPPDDATLIGSIVSDYPHWTVDEGACRQCAEIYTAAAQAF